MRRDFISNVSHELRTPVSVIMANSETLVDGALEDKNRQKSLQKLYCITPKDLAIWYLLYLIYLELIMES